MDGALIAFILPVVTALWGLSDGQTGLLGSSVLMGYLSGALTTGLLGDRIGRKKVMMWALAIYSLATLVAAMSPSWEFLFSFRLLAGSVPVQSRRSLPRSCRSSWPRATAVVSWVR
jgi:putative MFS transporter